MTLFFALNYGSLGRGGGNRIQEAFLTGALVQSDHLPRDRIRGAHQFNDCVIIGLALDQRYSPLELTVSPSLWAKPPQVCAQLTAPPSTNRAFYHNYIHGHTMLVRYLLPSMSLESIRDVYRGLIYFVLLTGLLVAFVQCINGRPESMIFVAVFVSFAAFFGLNRFSQSLSHGPADLILLSYLLYLSAAKQSERSAIAAGAVFGSLTAVFEFLTGGAPLGLAAVIGLNWFSLQKRDWRTVLMVGFAFCTAVAACFAIKYTVVAFVFGPEALFGVAEQLGTRMVGDLESPRIGVLGGMGIGLYRLGGITAVTLFFLSLLAAAPGTVLGGTPLRLLGLSILVILAWVGIFKQHTTIHAWFMSRILVWVIAAGLAGLAHVLLRTLERDDVAPLAKGRSELAK